MINLNVINRNEFTREDFDKFVKDFSLEVFTNEKTQGFAKSINTLIKKSETEELSKSEQNTVDVKEMIPAKITVKGRHDPCICPRILPIAESMVAIVIVDRLIKNIKN